MSFVRLPSSVSRLPVFATLLLFGSSPGLPAFAQESVSPLPPPVTRSLYRGHWFAFLNAHLEDDARAASSALSEMKNAARGVGVRRLSDFSRTLVHEGRKAESLGKFDRAARAYDAAIQLDDANLDAIAARIELLFRRGSYGKALERVPRAVGALLATRESRLALFSLFALSAGIAAGAAVLAIILILLLHHRVRVAHDLSELARRFAGEKGAVPLAILLFGLPLAFGFGPVWIALYWGALLYAYASSKERAVLIVGLLLFGLLSPFLSAISRENIIRRSPLFVAAVDLEERREDQSAEDGLRQASAVFPEDPDVWFLLGRYAERSGDSRGAFAAYDRAIQADSKEYRHFVNRGNVRFQEGDFNEALRDYHAAAERAPERPEIYYNMSLASAESYDFQAQEAAIEKARRLSPRSVRAWSENPTLQRVVPAAYTLSAARKKIEKWNAQSKSRRLPGHAPPDRVWKVFARPWTLAPWGALVLGIFLTSYRFRMPPAGLCGRCGAPFCLFCKRPGDPPLYCGTCVRLHLRKEDAAIGAHVAHAEEVRRRIRSEVRLCRFASLVFPGTHRFFLENALTGALLLFAFFLSLALLLLGGRFFDSRQLAPAAAWRATGVAAAATAIVTWLAGNLAAWRQTHGA